MVTNDHHYDHYDYYTYREIHSRIYFLGVKMEVIPNMQYKVNHYNWLPCLEVKS